MRGSQVRQGQSCPLQSRTREVSDDYHFLPQSCDAHLLSLFKVKTSLNWLHLSMASILRRSSIRPGSSTDLGTIPHRSGISFQAWRRFTADPSLSNSITSRCVKLPDTLAFRPVFKQDHLQFWNELYYQGLVNTVFWKAIMFYWTSFLPMTPL